MSKDTHTPDITKAYNLFHNGILALARVEQQGMRVDVDYIKEQNELITMQIKGLETQFYFSQFFADWKRGRKNKNTKINIYSSVQLSQHLYDVLQLKPKKFTTSGKGSTGIEALTQLNMPELDKLLQIKKLKKLRDTYLAGFLREEVDGFIHPFFNLHNAQTYRGSSNSPNFQNVPKRDEESMKIVRRALYPRKGHQLLELDYGQLEVRIACTYHQDPNMIKYIETGHDFHKDFAMEIFNLKEYVPKTHKVLRAATKNGFVFPEFYGDYYKNCAEYMSSNWCKLPQSRWKKGQGIMVGTEHLSDHLIRTGIMSYNDFEAHLRDIEDNMWNERFKEYARWKERWWRTYQRKGYFTSKTGFLYKGVMGRNDVINYPVQGAAFHVLLLALIEGMKALLTRGKMQTRIVGQIHDAIVFDVYPPELDKVIRIMKCIMENDVRQIWDWITVPLEIDAELCPVDGSWAEKVEYKI